MTGSVGLETLLERVGTRSDVLLEFLELLTAFVTIALFAIGAFDL